MILYENEKRTPLTDIEHAFLKSFLWISFFASLIVLVADAFAVDHKMLYVGVDILFALILLTCLFLIDKLPYKPFSVALIVFFALVISYQDESLTMWSCHLQWAVLIVLALFTVLILNGLTRDVLVGLLFGLLILIWAYQMFWRGDVEKEEQQMLIQWIMPYIGIFWITVIPPALLKKQYKLQREILEKTNQEVTQKNEEISQQHQELLASHEAISNFNKLLERLVDVKTQHIREKNEKLAQYAFANAHIVRGHMARITGLFQLAEMDGAQRDFYIEKINQEADLMNKSISAMGKELYQYVENTEL